MDERDYVVVTLENEQPKIVNKAPLTLEEADKLQARCNDGWGYKRYHTARLEVLP